MVLDSWTPLNVCPGIEDMPLGEMSLFDAVEKATGAHIAVSQMAYSARSAGKDLASVMGDTMLAAGQTIVGTAHQRFES